LYITSEYLLLVVNFADYSLDDDRLDDLFFRKTEGRLHTNKKTNWNHCFGRKYYKDKNFEIILVKWWLIRKDGKRSEILSVLLIVLLQVQKDDITWKQERLISKLS